MDITFKFTFSSPGLWGWRTATNRGSEQQGGESGDVLHGSMGISIWWSVEREACSCHLPSAGVWA